MHPPALYSWRPKNLTTTYGSRIRGYGQGNYTEYRKLHSGNSFPLWSGEDVRNEAGGDMISKNDGSPSAYHFHNFFTNAEEIHTKYLTYGHPDRKAMEKPIWEM